ncbi:amino acid adenylation domain-containing protein [Pseudomonas frederiksbergensis]|uniref:amino acid adenylation domain-containing protein n=1 Tax=Pseudomonas frederiksbergensis TaxID=104087 RepID=UPI003CFCBE60
MASSTDMALSHDSQADNQAHELASVQQGIWLDQMAHPELPYYNIGMVLEIKGRIDVGLLEKAIELIANRHDALRLSFSHEGGVARQTVLPSIEVKLDVVDFSEEDTAAGLAMAYVREAFRKPFDKLTGKLWEARLVRCGPERFYWLNRYHHLVTDGASVSLIGHAVSDAYNGLLNGDDNPPEGHSYISFLAEDRSYIESTRFERDRAFWHEKFAQLPPALLQQKVAVAGSGIAPSAQAQAMIPRALFNALAQFSNGHGMSLAHVLMAVLATYLCRTEGVDEIVIGMPVHNRTTARQKATVGMFSSLSPILLEVDPQASLLDLMQVVATQLRKCYRHQRFPIAELNRSLKLAQQGRRQLFDVSLSFESLDGDIHFGGMPSEVFTLDNGYERTPLAIFVRDYHPNEDVYLDFNFNTAFFTLDEVQQLQQRILSMLETVIEHHALPVGHFPIMPVAERQLLLGEFNATERDYPRDLLIHELFEHQAERRPEALAVSDDSGQVLTYAELNQRANQLAHQLIELGVGPDARVAVCLRRSPEMVIALLAILKAGGAYVPIDPDLPVSRREYMLNDAAPLAVLSSSELSETLPALSVPVLALNLNTHDFPDTNPQVPGLNATHLAYVLYTSGSTGMPKGVMNEHRGVVNRLLWARDEYRVDETDRVLQKTPFGFDVSVWEFFLPLLAGAQLVMARPGGHQEPDYLARVIRGAGITLLHFVPSMLELFLEDRDSQGFPGLRRVLCSGEALPRSLQKRFEQQLPEVELHNLYGPTEAAIDVTAWHCRPTDRGDSVPIGRPIANIQIRVLDSFGEPTPMGVSGEINIGGMGVARGYLNLPELSAERFVADPFSTDPDARLYKTGDLGRWLPDGSIEYMGRNDFQVKIRGFRIELGEIEAKLANHPDVKEVVVLAREDASGEKRLVAYYTTTDAALETETLRSHLQAQLPEYMVPAAYVRLDTLPLTSNGKLDRKALPAPDLTSLITRTYEAPVGEVEIALAQIWQDLLGVSQVGRRDQFFELGGHSLLAIQLISQVRLQLGVELGLADLFAQPELAALAQTVAEASRSTLPEIVTVSREEALPLSFAQQRLWFLAQMEGGSAAYHMPAGLRLRGTLDTDALQRALDRIVARHEALRTTFVQDQGADAFQRIAPAECGFALRQYDLRGQADAEVQLQVLAAEEEAELFDLEHGPLIRGRLIRLNAQDHVLLVTMHHIVSDGWSIGVLTTELAALYEAFRHGLDDPLPALAVQYADYAVWQRRWLSGEVLQTQNNYWQQSLADAPALLMLPTDRPRPVQQDYAGAALSVAFDASLTADLKNLSQRHGTTLYMTLMAGWAALLSRLAGQDEVVIGSPVANRLRAEVEDLIGFFVNTLAVRVDVSGAPNVETLLARVKAQTLGAQAHQDLPFEQVVEVLNPVRSLAHSPLFQAMLSWQTANGGELVLGDLKLETLDLTNRVAKFDLSLELGEVGGQLLGTLEYATALFDERTVQRYLGYFERVLRGMVADDQAQVDRIELLDAGERQRVLVDLNATRAPYPRDKTIHQLFEAQAEAQPDAIAVVFDGEQLSYAELNRQANQMAHHLIGLGIRPDDRVAICVERGAEMLVGLLAILKSGAGYVPLDPAYPAERLAYMLTDSTPAVLLTQRALQANLPALDVPVVLLDAEERVHIVDGYDDNPVILSLGVRHLAYVIYTSGSTGTPKGVMIEHRGLVNYTLDAIRLFGLTSADTVLQQNTLNFDLSVEEIFPALIAGATLAPSRSIFGTSQDTVRPTFLHLTAAHWHTLAAEWHYNPALAQEQLRDVRLINVTGDALSTQKLQMWEQVRPAHTKLVNTYGPTEATVSCTASYVTFEALNSNASIGTPMANTRIYLLDAYLQPVPFGVTGEIYIGGDGVARGYLNLDTITAERFLPDPFSNLASARLYKTGDLARYRPDGGLEYQGRNDFQVKVRGFRIELGEIEAKLGDCTGVKEAAVIVREDAPGDKRLVAYVVPQTGVTLTAANLRAQLAPLLAEYMLPSAFVSLEALPLTPNRKLDRRALPVPDAAAFASRTHEAAKGATEIALAQIWQDLLKVEAVGRQDHFFELGGHSLLAVSLIERLRQQNLVADVRTVFTAPTLRDMALAIERETRDVFQAPANLIQADCTALTPDLLPLVELEQAHIDRIVANTPGGAANIQDIYPLVPLQQGILFHHLLGHEGDAYLVRSLIEFDDRSRLDAFVAALQQVINRHDILRTAVQWTGLPQAVQIVQRHVELPVHTVILNDQEDALTQLETLSDPRHLRLDLTKAPLLCAHIAKDPQSPRWLLSLLDHHMVSDHVTLGILLEEVQAILNGDSASLPTPLPYRDFVAQTLASPPSAHEAYFRRRLADIDEPTAPFDLLNIQGDGSDVSLVNVRLDTTLAGNIRSAARKRGVTPAVLFHIAWALVLARCTGRNDVVFGTVVSGRLQGSAGAERALGVFINTLPVRVRLDEQTIPALVADTYRDLSALLAHEQASLALAQRCSGLSAGLPLFTTLLNYRHQTNDASLTHDGQVLAWEGIRFLSNEERTGYPIEIAVADEGENFSLSAQATAGIDPLRIAAYMTHAVTALVEALEHNPGQPVNSLDVLPATERQQLLTGFNDTATDFDLSQPLHALFEAQVRIRPEAIALVYEDQQLTFAQLNRRANHLARRLIALGLQPDQRVALCAERSPEMLIGLLGVLKAGGAYIPLDLALPVERTAFMLSESLPLAVLTQQGLAAQLQVGDTPLVLLDEHESLQAGNDPVFDLDPVIAGLTPQHLAYVMFTSGSTGKPKGVMVEHRNVVNLLRTMAETVGANANDRVLALTTLGFDIAGLELFLPLMCGARVVLASKDQAHDGRLLAEVIGRNEITLAQATPASWRMLLDSGWPGDTSLTALCGGDALPADLARRLAGQVKRLFNVYGPTETTIWSSAIQVIEQDTLGSQVSIGRPIANTRFYLLDAQGQPVPVGVSGEMYIGGTGVARGYLNRPDLSAERFLTDPFSTVPNARMYRTGDLGRWLANGTLEFLGRNDFQVKIRGLRIELGEIENALMACPGVREAVVIARDDTPEEANSQRLVAYLCGNPVPAELLRAELLKSLPDYMVPSAYVQLDALPLTPNGKLDRKALPAPGQDAVASRIYEAPQGENEIAIASIWQDLLHLKQVGRHDGFLELGGHSLLTVQLQARLHQVLGVEIALRTLFAQATLSAMALCVSQASLSLVQPIPLTSRQLAPPLSMAQQRLWFLDQLDHAASAAYHLPAALRLSGALDQNALRRALDRIVARHESLRTTFERRNDEVGQYFAPADVGFALIEHDLQRLPPEAREHAITELAQIEAHGPFDLSRGPLIRGRLLRLDENEHVLLVTQHHIVTDGWSVALLIEEFNALYTAFSQGQDDPLPDLALQYADYAVWQREWLQGEVLQSQTRYWTQVLDGAPALLELPADRPRPHVQSYIGSSVPLRLSPALSSALRRFSQQQGLTPFMTLLGAWSVLLARLSNQPQVVIGTPVANRPRAETEALIGFFVNTLALRIDLHDQPSVGQLLARIKSTTLDAYSHQELPFEQVVEALQPERSLGHSPLFQAMLVFGNTPHDRTLELPGLQLSPLVLPLSTTQTDLTLSLNDDGQTITGQFEYATDLFDASTIERWGRHFLCLLEAMLTDTTQAVGALPLLDAEQYLQVLKDFNPSAEPLDENPDRLPQKIFETQAARTPEAIALVSAGESLSYATLNARANGVAHRLIKLGVKPDDTVGLCARRSADMVIGLLGILKAGAAYVPLDPQYPPERLAHMLADSAPRVLVRQQGLEMAVPVDLATIEIGSDEITRNPQIAGLTVGNLAYVIYTSGSTGLPKGVMVEHRGLRNLLDWYLKDLAFSANDAVLLASSYNFDLTQKNILAPLMVGAVLHLAEEPFDPAAIVKQIAQSGITHINMSPSAFHALVDSDHNHSLASLKRVVLGGEPIPLAMLEKLQAPRPTVINSYGPTECSDVVAWQTLSADLDDYKEQSIPIGKPIRNLQLHVLDTLGHLVPIGVRGEIHIGGTGVARGYLNQPELTAERFITDPFAATSEARLYKTGDIGRWLPDGTLEYLGRDDDQVKIRGLRIELSEIEAVLANCQGVREVAVIAREYSPGQPDSTRLIAYLCGEPAPAEQLRSELLAYLPEYMVPSAFVRLDVLPLTPNGKLDRRALPAPGADAFASRDYEAPLGEVETVIAGIWQDLLGLEKVGRHDRFFELGGHSLMAVSLIDRLREHGLGADVRMVFASPSLREMARAIDRDARDIFHAPPNLIVPGATELTPQMLPLIELDQAQIDTIVAGVPGGIANIQDIYPLAPLQQGILFHHLLGHAGDAYLIRSMIEFDDREGLDRFIAALQQVIDRHDILRTSVQWNGLPEPVQIVQRNVALAVHTVTLDPKSPALAQLETISDPRQLRLDLSQAPLLRAYIGRDPHTQRWLLALLNHHMVSDHVTLEIVLEEIQTILQGQGDSLTAPMPYRDFVAQILATPIEADEEYFQRRLADIDQPTAPFGLLDVQGDGSDVEEVSMRFDDGLTRLIRAQARERGITPAVLFHVAWAQLIGRCSGRDDVVFGTVVSGRLQGSAGAERALGVFINTLPVRVNLAQLGANALVAETHRDLSELLAHEQASLALAQRCSAVPASLPLFSSLFNYRHQLEDDAAPTQWPGARILSEAERDNYPLTVSVNDYQTDLSLTVQCSPAVNPQRICDMMQRALEQLTQALAHTPDVLLTQLDLLPAQERERLLVEFSQTAPDIQWLAQHSVSVSDPRLYVLDPAGQLAPIGVTGEIHIGGAENPGTKRFINHPFSADPKARLYKSGDLGRWLADGTLEITGSQDDQLTLGGVRIEASEIETALLACKGVSEAVVMAIKDASGSQRLVAYLCGEPAATDQLRAELLTRLPEHWVPDAFVVIDALPLTANGKLDRRSLPAPWLEAVEASHYEAPKGDTEQKLAALWSDLLGIERIGRNDQFFELGGHSLIAVQLTLRAREHFGVEVTLKALFEHASLRELADLITTLQLALYESEVLLDLERELASLSESDLLAIVSKDA